MNKAFQYTSVSAKILEAVELPSGTFYPDLSQVSKRLSKRLNLQDFEVKIEKTAWRLEEEFNIYESDNLDHLSFLMPPLEGELHWIMDPNEVAKITAWAMTKDVSTKTFSSEILQEGFYHYLILEAMDAVDQDDILKGFSLKILPEPAAFQSLSLCLDIRLIYRDRSAYAQLIVPQKIVQEWKKYFFKESDLLASKMATIADFFLSIKIGSVSLNYATFDTITAGDFIILDHSYYDPKTHQGNVLLVFNQTPLYQGKIKQNKLTILDFAELKEDSMEDIEQTTSAKEVPLSIQIEMGKIKMSLDRLMSLTPGEVVETTINPDEKVSLILNNKAIAKGELVKVGETIGVRILEIS